MTSDAKSVTVIRIGRPEARNAIDSATAERLHREIAAFEADPGARVAVLYGDERAFSAGADLKKLPALRDDGPLGPSRRPIAKPVIAAIEGWCVAGGIELAALCDLRVAGDGARFGFFDRHHGVPLVDGGTVRMPRIVGLGRALDIILTGREFGADEAREMGFVNRVVPAGTALEAATELAAHIASRPWNCLLGDRSATYASFDLATAEALANEQRIGEDTIFSVDFIRGAARRTLRSMVKKAMRPLPDVEKLLVEAAELACGIGEVNLQDPVGLATDLVLAAHRRRVVRGDVGLGLRPVHRLVRELADQVPGVPPAEGPAGVGGQPVHLGVQVRAGDLGVPGEVVPAR